MAGWVDVNASEKLNDNDMHFALGMGMITVRIRVWVLRCSIEGGGQSD